MHLASSILHLALLSSSLACILALFNASCIFVEGLVILPALVTAYTLTSVSPNVWKLSFVLMIPNELHSTLDMCTK